MNTSSDFKQSIMNRVIQEKMTAIQANIQYMHNKENEINTVVVTSANKGEGKSYFCEIFAKNYAQYEHKVLLIDVDFYSPSLTKKYNLMGRIGLSNVLTNRSELKNVIHEMDGNIDFISIGVIPPNPLKLLQIQGLNLLVEEALGLGYSYIIFDCPPINLFMDSRIVASYCDLGIIVTNCNKTKEDELVLANSHLERSGVKMIGSVLNNVKYNKKKYHAYEY